MDPLSTFHPVQRKGLLQVILVVVNLRGNLDECGESPKGAMSDGFD